MPNLALITGGGGSLGSEVAKRLHGAGHKIVLSGRDEQKLIKVGLPSALCVRADLAKAEDVKGLFVKIKTHFGSSPDILAHCAGGVMIRPLHRTSPEQFSTCLRNNLDSAFYALQGFVNGLLDSKTSGCAVLISSIAARIGISNHAAVAAAKAGIDGMIRSAAATYAGHAIRINGVAPGMMRSAATEGFFSGAKAQEQIAAQYPLGRHGLIEDAAALVCWLLSPEASWITGQIIAVDGGFSATRPLIKK